MDNATDNTVRETQLHFSISGEFITETARDFMFENGWRSGYTFLLESLHGMDSNIALDILQGKKRLDGVNDLELVDETPEVAAQIQARLDFLFRDTFSFDGKLWRPYGYVSGGCAADMRLAREIDAGQHGEFLTNKRWRKAQRQLWGNEADVRGIWRPYQELIQYRSVYYMDNPSEDITVYAVLNLSLGAQPVHCELVDEEPPLWYEVTKDHRVVVGQAFQKGRLKDLFEVHFGSEEAPEGRFSAASLRREAAAQEAAANGDIPREAESGEEGEEGLNWEDPEQRAERVRATLERMFERQLESAKTAIAQYADQDSEHGWKEYQEYDSQAGRQVKIRVPMRAFICAALSRAKAKDQMPAYQAFSPSDVKLPNDCRYHTDAWLGCGGEPDNAYDNDLPEQRLFMSKLYELQRELLTLNFDLLARGKEDYVYGEVTHNPQETSKERILVLGPASPEFADAALRSKAVIVETGSKLAHLVVVSREAQVSVIRVADARQRFPEGCRVSIDFSEGSVERAAI